MAEHGVQGSVRVRRAGVSTLAGVAVLVHGVAASVSPGTNAGPSRVEPADQSWASYRAHVAAAEASLRLNEPGRAREWLDGAPAEHRGWEWRHLDRRLNASLGAIARDADGFMGLSVAPDGRRAAALSARGRLSIVALPEGTPVRSWDAHTEGGGFTVCFSPDGKRLASSGADRLVKIWNAESGELLRAFDAHKFPVGGLAWSPDGTRLASSAYFMDKETPIEGRVHLWRADDGALLHTLRSGRKPIVCVDWSADGRLVAAGTWDSEVAIWSADDGASVRVISEKPGEDSSSHVDCVALSPDASLVAYGSDRKWVRVHRVQDGALVAELTAHGEPVSSVRFSPDGARLATGAGDDNIRVWDTGSWSCLATLRAHEGRVRAIAFAQDGDRLYSASLDGTCRAWDPHALDCDGVRMRHTSANYAVSFSPDGTRLAGAGYKGQVPIWSARTGALEVTLAAHEPSPVCASDWSPDGSRLVTCSWDKSARVFDPVSRTEVFQLAHAAGIAYVTWGVGRRNGQEMGIIATACTDKTAHLWDGATGEALGALEGHESGVNEARLSPDGRHVATASRDKTVRLWDVVSRECLRTLRGHTGGVLSVSYSPDGSRIATGAEDGTVRLWSTVTGEELRTLFTADEAIHRVAFSPSGDRIAAGGRELVLIDPSRPGPAARLRPHADQIWNLEWSPDGARLASGSWDGTVVILDGSARSGPATATPTMPRESR